MESQDDERRRAWARLLGPLGVGLAFYALAALSLGLTRGLASIAAIWPCNGILLAGLLLAPRGDAWRYAVAGTAASLAVNVRSDVSLALAAAFTAANVAEAVLAAWLLRRGGRPVPSFVCPRDVGRFCAAAGAASLVGAALATTLSGLLSPGFALAWLTTDLLGVLIVTPIVLVWADLIATWGHEGAAHPTAGAGVLVLGGVAAVAALTFAQSALPLLFLPLAALLAATWRLGPPGATASVLVIALMGSVLTGLGRGPVGFVQGGDKAALFFFQFYLLVLLASALPLAALLAARDRLHRTLAEAHRMLAMAERAAEAGHWRIDVRRREVFWSEGAARVYGRAADAPPSFEAALDGYHPEDRATVAAAVARSSATGEPFEFQARVLRPDGTERHAAVRGWAERGPRGDVRALFGAVQDVTEHVAARRAAEGEAAAAARLADTDGLTGLPNRRRFLRLLDEALAVPGRPLAVAMLDVDHFKAVNDRWGHAAGDEVLARVARAAQGSLREGCAVGRLGGEEFALLMPGADAGAALAMAEEVRAAIEASGSGGPDDAGGAGGPPVTVSVGVAACGGGRGGGGDAGDLLARADRALYEAKGAGRNRLRLAA